MAQRKSDQYEFIKPLFSVTLELNEIQATLNSLSQYPANELTFFSQAFDRLHHHCACR